MTKPETEKLMELAATFETCVDFLPPHGRKNIAKAVAELRGLALRAQGDGATPDAAPDAVCNWSINDDECGLWQSDCGVLFQFTSDGPVENDMKFCHCCGKTLIAHARSAGGEGRDE